MTKPAKTTNGKHHPNATGEEAIHMTGDKTSDTTGDKPVFVIQRIYTKDLSFEAPHSPHIFQEDWQPQADVQLNAATQKLAENLYEVKLSITITTRVKDKVAFLAEIHQAGIFNIANIPEPQLHHMLGSYCPNVLFPFARELASDLIIRGGFPPLYLAPINFDALYEQQMAQQKNPSHPERSSENQA